MNGHIEKIDTNFFKQFQMNEILFDNINKETNDEIGKLFIGPYPESYSDF